MSIKTRVISFIRSSSGKTLLALYALAVVVRLVYLVQISDMPTFDHPVMDEGYHVELADELRSEGWLLDEPFYRAPLYPYFFAAALEVTGDNYFAVRVIQILLGSLLPLLIFQIGLKLFDRRIALTAAIAAALYPTFIYFDSSLLITSLMTLLTTWVVWRSIRAEESPSAHRFAMLGLLIGLAALARPNILFCIPGILLFYYFTLEMRTKGARGYLLVVAALICLNASLVILPVTVRNWIVTGDLIPIAWQGGYNFFLGNNHQATGWSATAPGIRSSWQGGYEDAINLAEADLGRKLTEKEIDDYWWSQGFKEIAMYPDRFLELAALKKWFVFTGYEIPNNQSIYISERFSSLAQFMFARSPIYLPFGLVAPLALFGMIVGLRNWRKYLALYMVFIFYFASLILFFVCARYRQPIIPIMLLFASYGAFELWRFVSRRRWTALGASLTLLAGLFWFSNYDIVGLDPELEEANSSFLLAGAYQGRGETESAKREYERTLQSYPDFAEAYVNLGIIEAGAGDFARAEQRFNSALRIAPQNPQALMNLGMLMMQSDRLSNARTLLQRAAKYEAFDYNIHFRLGLVYHYLEEYELADSSYSRALKLKPGFTPARENLERVRTPLDSLETP